MDSLISFPITTERFVALFDIMGFSDRIMRQGHQHVLSMMDKFQMIVGNVNNSIGGHPNSNFSTLKSVIFSDSVLLITDNSSDEAMYLIVEKSSEIMRNCLAECIPMKGSIAYGTFTSDFERSLYFGAPLVDAYALQNELFLYGAVMNKSFHARFNSSHSRIADKIVHQLPVPFKTGLINHLTLDYFPEIEVAKPQVEKFYEIVDGSARKYVDNTLYFLEEVKQRRH